MRPVLQHLANTERIAAVSLSTWAPELDQDNHSQSTVLELLQLLM